MATLREYFDNDFPDSLKVAKPIPMQFQKSPPIEVQARLHLDFVANAKYVSCYFPEHPAPLSAFVAVLERLDVILDFTKEVPIQSCYVGERKVDSAELLFTGRVYLYSEADLPVREFERLHQEAHQNGVSLCVRSQHYAIERSRLEKPLAFICHDSRDKETVARPIAIGLSKLMCPVWYDEYSLRVGDRLREAIERGLKECKKCVLVLSANFFGNSGWTRAEFNSIFTRELIERKDFLLPVWSGVTKEQVFHYSPSLADRVGVNWDLGAEEVLRRLHRAICEIKRD